MMNTQAISAIYRFELAQEAICGQSQELRLKEFRGDVRLFGRVVFDVSRCSFLVPLEIKGGLWRRDMELVL